VEPRLSLLTLGVADLARSTAFYEALGWQRRVAQADGVAFFQLGPMALSLFPRTDLAADAGVAPSGSGFAGFALAHNLRTRPEVDAAVTRMIAAGATLVRAPHDQPWGGYSGYIADPDGFLWELAWNPGFPLGENGELTLPA
jgi:catechol 2,3-dioxygenase-like lactoylglutathione lyase family enzyme